MLGIVSQRFLTLTAALEATIKVKVAERIELSFMAVVCWGGEEISELAQRRGLISIYTIDQLTGLPPKARSSCQPPSGFADLFYSFRGAGSSSWRQVDRNVFQIDAVGVDWAY